MLLNFLMFFENILKWIKTLTTVGNPTITVAWSNGDKQATVTLTFPSISNFEDKVLAALTSFINAHESVASFQLMVIQLL